MILKKGSLMPEGNRFQRAGATTAKALSPAVLSRALGSTNWLGEFDLSVQVGVYLVKRSQRYCGALSCKHL